MPSIEPEPAPLSNPSCHSDPGSHCGQSSIFSASWKIGLDIVISSAEREFWRSVRSDCKSDISSSLVARSDSIKEICWFRDWICDWRSSASCSEEAMVWLRLSTKVLVSERFEISSMRSASSTSI